MNKTDSNLRGSLFERLAVSELLKTYDLSEDQIENGIVDGGDDGGIDGLFIFVNGNYLSEATNYNWPKENGKLEIYIITCKHRNTYELAPLESMDSSISELLNFTISDSNLSRKYNDKILQKRNLLYKAYRKLAFQNISPIINLYYISRGDSSRVPENIRCAGNKVKTSCSSIFENASISMTFWGTGDLISQIRKKRNAPVEIKVQRYFQLGCNFVILVNIEDYINSILDDDGKLKRYLFDENVRDYLGSNHTNSDIMSTLEDTRSPDFWLLNNGITMLTSNAVLFDNIITIEDVQIVNGLQTTFTIYNFFGKGRNNCNNRKVLIKVIKPESIEVSKKIIKATNNQSAIPLYALHANDKIQRDIEDILLKNDFYYERRPMYYTNLGYPPRRIITPLYIACGYTALILKLPHRAATLKSKFMDNQTVCDRIFSESTDLNLWPVIADILKRTDAVTEQYRGIVKKSTEKYLRNVRYIVSLVTLARVIGKYSFGVNDLLHLNIERYSNEIVMQTTESLIQFINESNIKTVSNLNSRNTLNMYLRAAAQQFSIPDVRSIVSRSDMVNYENRVYELSDGFLQSVQSELPQQPWPMGIHKKIASKLNCPNAKVSQAISVLIEKKVFFRQVDGIVYDHNGEIIAKDISRVSESK